MFDIDDIVAAHDSDYINGTRHRHYDHEYSKRELMMYDPYHSYSDDEDEEEDDYDMETSYTDENGQVWFVYLNRSEYEYMQSLSEEERIRYLESIEEL